MTEEQWLACDDWWAMRQEVSGSHLRGRKLRLLARAVCGWVTHLLDNEALLALGVAERFADGLAGPEELYRARNAARQAEKWQRGGPPGPARFNAVKAVRVACREDHNEMGQVVLYCSLALNVEGGAEPLYHPRGWLLREGYRERCSSGDVALLLREIAGNPFRPSTLSPHWRTPDVCSIAEAAYSERVMPAGELVPARLSILADALEDAGCDDESILGHLRSAGPHVRGCWALDLILGKQ